MKRRVLVIQLGQTGLAFVRHFAALGCEIEVVDERDDPPCAPEMEREFPGLSCRQVTSYMEHASQARGYDDILVSPGVSPARLPPTLRVEGDLGCFLDAYRARWHGSAKKPHLVAITGTNGKSTVTRLVAGMLTAGGDRADAVGNIGEPLLDALRRWEETEWPQFVVMELSSFQLARLDTPLEAEVACVLNVTPDHLDWHGSDDAYTLAKLSAYQGANVCVFNRQDSHSLNGARDAGQKMVGFGDLEGAVAREWAVADGDVAKVGVKDLRVPAAKLAATGIMPESACAAFAVAGAAAPWHDEIAHLRWLDYADGLPHRFEHVGDSEGVLFINDSKATNCAATVQALDWVQGHCVLIAGGQAKGQEFNGLTLRARPHVVEAVLLGEASEILAEAFDAADIPTHRAVDMEDAVCQAAKCAKEGNVEVVLFSPACASMDMFRDFAARGDAFKEAVTQSVGLDSVVA